MSVQTSKKSDGKTNLDLKTYVDPDPQQLFYNFRFFYKKPELLKEQANVYDLKIAEKRTEAEEEPRHLPMRLGEQLKFLSPPASKLDQSPNSPKVYKPQFNRTLWKSDIYRGW